MRILMMGTGPFALPTFDALLASEHDVFALVTRPTREGPGRKGPPPTPMRDRAQAVGLEIHAPESANSAEFVAQLQAWHPDLLVVCDYGQILSSEVLATARLGGINLHGSLLPRYRGAAPINWCVYDGEAETGVTVIHMTPALDAGPAIVRRSTPIGPQEDAVELEQRLAELGAEAVREAVAALEDWDGQTVLGEMQDPALATRARRLRKQDGRVDWTRSAQQIANQVRAFKPWPGTYLFLPQRKGQALRVILDQVRVVSNEELNGMDVSRLRPGEIVAAPANQWWIAAAEGILAVEQLQPAGKRLMPVNEFLRGHRLEPGMRLDEP